MRDAEGIPIAGPYGTVHILGQLSHTVGPQAVAFGEARPSSLRPARQAQISGSPNLALRVFNCLQEFFVGTRPGRKLLPEVGLAAKSYRSETAKQSGVGGYPHQTVPVHHHRTHAAKGQAVGFPKSADLQGTRIQLPQASWFAPDPQRTIGRSEE